MRNKILSVLLSLGLMLSFSVTARAETSHGDPNWHVAFTAEKEMDSNFKASDLRDVAYGMQPGDNMIVTLALKNENKATTDWYMTNEVLHSLEDRSANSATGGGAYTYRLVYTDVNGAENVLFDSDTVGGDEGQGDEEGLHEATGALEDYFYLDTLTSGQSGKITLEVALDGETQGNDYQDTLADLQMNFAVELNNTTPSRNGNDNEGGTPEDESRRGDVEVAKTGDEDMPGLYLALMAGSGLVLLLLAIFGWRSNRKEKEGGAGK